MGDGSKEEQIDVIMPAMVVFPYVRSVRPLDWEPRRGTASEPTLLLHHPYTPAADSELAHAALVIIQRSSHRPHDLRSKCVRIMHNLDTSIRHWSKQSKVLPTSSEKAAGCGPHAVWPTCSITHPPAACMGTADGRASPATAWRSAGPSLAQRLTPARDQEGARQRCQFSSARMAGMDPVPSLTAPAWLPTPTIPCRRLPLKHGCHRGHPLLP